MPRKRYTAEQIITKLRYVHHDHSWLRVGGSPGDQGSNSPAVLGVLIILWPK